jgi:hypothetical protein
LQELADSNLKAWQNMQDAMLGRHKTDDKKDDKQ